MRNRVFRCIEHRARGFVGLLLGELAAGAVVVGVFIFLGHPLIGLGLGGALLLGLSVWRRRDYDRVDYAKVAFRRMASTRRLYAPGSCLREGRR